MVRYFFRAGMLVLTVQLAAVLLLGRIGLLAAPIIALSPLGYRDEQQRKLAFLRKIGVPKAVEAKFEAMIMPLQEALAFAAAGILILIVSLLLPVDVYVPVTIAALAGGVVVELLLYSQQARVIAGTVVGLCLFVGAFGALLYLGGAQGLSCTGSECMMALRRLP